MSWIVEGYEEEVSNQWVPVIENEISALLDTDIGLDVAALVDWLLGLPQGKGAPQYDPDMAHRGLSLKYRVFGDAVAIFALVPSQTLRLLVVSHSASAYPKGDDLNLAAQRLVNWRTP